MWFTFTEAFERMKGGEWFMPANCYLGLEKRLAVSMGKNDPIPDRSLIVVQGDWIPNFHFFDDFDGNYELPCTIFGRSIAGLWCKAECHSKPTGNNRSGMNSLASNEVTDAQVQ